LDVDAAAWIIGRHRPPKSPKGRTSGGRCASDLMATERSGWRGSSAAANEDKIRVGYGRCSSGASATGSLQFRNGFNVLRHTNNCSVRFAVATLGDRVAVGSMFGHNFALQNKNKYL
jgi:hypothetical protein